MIKKHYNAPAIEQEEVVLEAGIAASATIIIEDNEEGTVLEDWKEGNTDWW